MLVDGEIGERQRGGSERDGRRADSGAAGRDPSVPPGVAEAVNVAFLPPRAVGTKVTCATQFAPGASAVVHVDETRAVARAPRP